MLSDVIVSVTRDIMAAAEGNVQIVENDIFDDHPLWSMPFTASTRQKYRLLFDKEVSVSNVSSTNTVSSSTTAKEGSFES